MKEVTWSFWLGIVAIVGSSAAIAFFAPISEFFKGLTTIPAIGALSFAAFQIFRDHLSHLRTAELQNQQQLFNLGATSHMANVVFDKHVEFCEKYISEVHETTLTLFQKGPTKEALNHAGSLYKLRIEYSAWITPEMVSKLEPFEDAIRHMGADAGLVAALETTDDKDGVRSNAIERMYDTFRKTLNLEEFPDEDPDAVNSAKAIQNAIRKILQVDELVHIREHLVKNAASLATDM